MGCPKPYLDPDNEFAWRIFSAMTNQPLLGGMGGYIGVDFNMFEPLCNAYGVPASERRFLLDKVIILNKISGEFWRQEEQARADREKADRESKAKQR